MAISWHWTQQQIVSFMKRPADFLLPPIEWDLVSNEGRKEVGEVQVGQSYEMSWVHFLTLS